jgi:hypothetical protein
MGARRAMRALRDEGFTMPKDRIYDSSELFDIEIGWARDHSVQLGIITHDGRSLAAWLAGQGALDGGHVPPGHPQTWAAVNDGVPTLPNDEPKAEDLPQFSSLWASLDRAAINRLIKSLRKARDAAYGADE